MKGLLQKKVCRGCGKKFTPKRTDQVYCREDCRNSHYALKYGSAPTKKICPNCRTEFPTTMPKKQTYCSPECREDAQKKRDEGKFAQIQEETLTRLNERFCVLERDGFKCTYCGRGPRDNAVLGVVEHGGGFRTICELCKAGREFSAEN